IFGYWPRGRTMEGALHGFFRINSSSTAALKTVSTFVKIMPLYVSLISPRPLTHDRIGAFVADGTPAVDTGNDIATQVRDLSAAVQDINRRLARLEKEPRKT